MKLSPATSLLVLGFSSSSVAGNGIRAAISRDQFAGEGRALQNYNFAWSSYSESNEEIDCGGNPNALVSGVGCKGPYCDDVRLYCRTGGSSHSESSSYWTQTFVSEETDPLFCAPDYFTTGLRCDGWYCDNLYMQCTKSEGRTYVENCFWSDWLSEESGTISFTDTDTFVRGIECSGWFCDDKRMLVCPALIEQAPTEGITALKLFHTPPGQPNQFVADLFNGDEINVSSYTPPLFNIQAYNVGNIVQSVTFSNGKTEGKQPFAYCGDSGGVYNACDTDDLGIGTFTVSATPTGLDDQPMAAISATFTLSLGPAPTPSPTTSPAPTGVFNLGGKWIEVDGDANLRARHEACFVMAGRKAVLIGGRGGRGVDIYDPVTRTWREGADPPHSEIHHMQCVAVDNKVYIVAAWTGWFPRETNAEHVYVYDHLSDSWESKTALPEARRRGGAAAVVVGRNIYLSHGNRGGHEREGTNHAESNGWLDYYNVDTDTWTTGLPDAPNPRDHTGGALVNGNLICVAGGRNGGIVDWPEVAATDCFNLSTQTWSVAAPIPQVRGGSSYGQTCDGQLIVAGGEGDGKAYDNVDVFDGTSWTTIDSLITQRHGSGLAVDCICNQIHIASGSEGQGGGPEITSVETFFPGGVDVACPA